jgi:hypothetical protein
MSTTVEDNDAVQQSSKRQKLEAIPNDSSSASSLKIDTAAAADNDLVISQEHIFKNMRLKMLIKENHGAAIHRIVPNWIDVRFQNLVATVGGEQVSLHHEYIVECELL